jgi:hypothetical protein
MNMILIEFIQKFTEAIKNILLTLFKWILQLFWKAFLALIKAIIEFFKNLIF